LKIEQYLFNSYLSNYAFDSAITPYMIFRTRNSAGSLIENMKLSPTLTQITTNLTCNNGFTLSGGTLSLPNNSILDSALSSNVVLRGAINVLTALNTFNGGLTVSSGLTLYNNAITDGYLSPNVPLLNIDNTFTGATNTFNSLTLSLNSNFSQSGSGKIIQTSSTSKNTLNPTQFLGDITFATGVYRINNVNTATNILPTISCSNQLTLPNSQIINSSTPTLVDLSSSQTLTNKTLTDCIANTQLSSDNSTKIATTAFVKSLNYLTSSSSISDSQVSSNISKLNNNNTYTGTNQYNNDLVVYTTTNYLKLSDETASTRFSQNLGDCLITNMKTFSGGFGDIILSTTDTASSTSERVRISYDKLKTNVNIELPSTFTTPTSGQLGYIAPITYKNTTTFNLASGTNYNIASITLNPGSYIITGQGGAQLTGASSVTNIIIQLSISSTSATIDNASYIIEMNNTSNNTNNIKQLTRIVSITSQTIFYLVLNNIYGAYTVSYNSNSYAFTSLTAMRIG
jgi:hypothetical protein